MQRSGDAVTVFLRLSASLHLWVSIQGKSQLTSGHGSTGAGYSGLGGGKRRMMLFERRL